MLSSMGDGEITVSPYDTAWVALIKDANDNGCPQFPSSLRWIVDHQLPDGSWGDRDIFVAYDRIINTLACVVALKSWNICPKSCERGISFLRKNIDRLEEEDIEHMPIGFEVAFPSLVEIALTMDLGLPFDSPAVKDIYAQRTMKLNKIPKEVMHNVPTTLLHSLEGMRGLDWERLLSLQCLEGSFLFSPSSTAFAFAQTRDQNCLRYLERMIDKFDGGVPNVYPVDLFEHLWVVDRLDRLGISRYFESEIKICLDYVNRMPLVNNNQYLELAKSDFNRCQALHQLEWLTLQRWYIESGLGELGVNLKDVLKAYFLAASSVFEPDRAAERLGWARTAVLAEAVLAHFRRMPPRRSSGDLSSENSLGWEEWLMTWQADGDGVGSPATLLVRVIELCAGGPAASEIAPSHRPYYDRLTCLTNSICNDLYWKSLQGNIEESNGSVNMTNQTDSKMQELAQCVLQGGPNGLDCRTKKTFLSVVKSYYYVVCCPPATIDLHMAKVLFEKVV
ncbi:hypothetical protein QJS10_CPA10g00229 [Acorus calamus]|uniref:Terpene synthase N-terminal domain-containing protein n=1 Tax=Acorus calamus TaxID=4465 RepID=A0AAV9E4M2_ACOCL|nr:hypothetical protein QJS10_CPA10g00229 [Acorus calamus]